MILRLRLAWRVRLLSGVLIRVLFLLLSELTFVVGGLCVGLLATLAVEVGVLRIACGEAFLEGVL